MPKFIVERNIPGADKTRRTTTCGFLTLTRTFRQPSWSSYIAAVPRRFTGQLLMQCA